MTLLGKSVPATMKKIIDLFFTTNHWVIHYWHFWRKPFWHCDTASITIKISCGPPKHRFRTTDVLYSTRESSEARRDFLRSHSINMMGTKHQNKKPTPLWLYDSRWILFGCLAWGGWVLDKIERDTLFLCPSLTPPPPTGHFTQGDGVAKTTRHGSLDITRVGGGQPRRWEVNKSGAVELFSRWGHSASRFSAGTPIFRRAVGDVSEVPCCAALDELNASHIVIY